MTAMEWILIALAVAVMLLACAVVGLVISFFRAIEHHDDREGY